MQIFLCHSSGDKTAVRGLYERLLAESFDPWLDVEKLHGGQDWELEIKRAVRSSGVVVVCLSHESITKDGYVQKEIKFALDVADEKPEGTIFIIPLKLEECDVPDRLRKWQWIDYLHKDGFEKLRLALSRATASRAEPQAPPAPPLSRGPSSATMSLNSGVKPSVTLTNHGDPTTYRVDGRILSFIDGTPNPHTAPFRCELQVGGITGELDALLGDGEWANVILGSLEPVYPTGAQAKSLMVSQQWIPVGHVLVIRRGRMGHHVQVPDSGAVVQLDVRAMPPQSEPLKPKQLRVTRDGDIVYVTEL